MRFLKQQRLNSKDPKDTKVSVGVDGKVTLDSNVTVTGDIIGQLKLRDDLVVQGTPYGTFPVVKNILYVTSHGSDTNDGSALDSTKACRTIGGALKSPLYGPGTSIKVAPGHYLENNPLILKPYTSIIGSDLRTTTVEPIHKTQDLFHMNSSCYIAQMQFLNGRSGIIDPEIDRGAFSIAFPPILKNSIFKGYIENNLLTVTEVIQGSIDLNKNVISDGIPENTSIVAFESGNTSIGTYFVSSPNDLNITFGGPEDIKLMGINGEKIILYKSPYIQNCTNQSGPWLYDGTMFVPNQTVQVPKAVGHTTYTPNEDGSGQTSIDVTVTEGTIETGMSINTAPQDQGFFDARTLLLANKSFVQEQVINYIARTYPTLVYQTEKCRRDVGIIIENILYDSTFGGNSKSVEAGLAYYNGTVSILPAGESTVTIDALTYINDLAQLLITNSTIPTTLIPEKTSEVAVSWKFNGNVITVTTAGHNLKIDDKVTILGTTAATNPPNGGPYTIFAVTATTFKFAVTQAPVGPIGGTLVYTKVDTYSQYINNSLDGSFASVCIANNIQIIKDILLNVSNAPTIFYSTGPEFGLVSAEILLQQNKDFVSQKVIDYLSSEYPTFTYNQEKCKRDLGLIIDAVSQDVLIGGNSKSIEAGMSYYKANRLVISATEKPKTIDALVKASEICVKIVTRDPLFLSQNQGSLFIDPYFFGSEDPNVSLPAIAENMIVRNFDHINKIIENGLSFVPNLRKHNGTSLFAATGISSDDVKEATIVTSVTPTMIPNKYTIGLNKPTVGIGTNSTLYFGYTTVYPTVKADIPDRWAGRRLDPYGSVGGMLVDGSVLSNKSPIKSMVMDAYTQVNQGGRGIKVTNNGYAQLVSVFTIFCSISVQVENGGICSITNSNNNFGDLCLVAKGYGKREFFGTVYNPPELPLYPQGKYPSGGKVQIFVPDKQFRPHISLIMEVEPPTGYTNDQGKPGFLTAGIDLATISEGTLEITNIDVTGMYIGQTVYLRDQFGNYNDPVSSKPYLKEGTTVSDLGYQKLILSQPINVTGGNPNIPTYFRLFTTGNAYYTVISSELASDPYPIGKILLPTSTMGSENTYNQVSLEIEAINYLRDTLLTYDIQSSSKTRISNLLNGIVDALTNPLTVYGYINETTLTISDPIDPNIQVGQLLIGKGIVDGTRIKSIVSPGVYIVDKEQTITPGSFTIVNSPLIVSGITTQADSDARTIILNNIDTIAQDVSNWLLARTDEIFLARMNLSKCLRDVKLICRCLADDLKDGGNYYSVYSGLSYYGREGTYHVVNIEEYTVDTRLFQDGAFVNFYQRSYMSASGYLFEYVGSGTDYGALPMVGRIDPDQTKEVTMLNGGKVFFTSTDQNGDFRIGPGLVISQATGTLSGRTFQKSLFAEMTPFILALE